MCNKIADRHYDLSRHSSTSPSRWYRREQRRLDNRVHSNTSNIQLGEARRGLSSLRCAYLYLFSRFSYSITILHLISLFGLGSLNCLLPPVGGKQLKHLAAWVQGARDTCRENTRPALARSLSNYPCDANMDLAALWESANEWCHVRSDWTMSQVARERILEFHNFDIDTSFLIIA